MRELVIVPTYQRRAFLSVCLEAIRGAEPTIPLHVFPDRGEDETEVCERFGAVHHLTIQQGYHGNSYNIMEALKWAYQQQAELVYLIEDDSIIDPTFFSWCRNALASKPDAFAACGWRYSPDAIISDGPDLLIPWYLSVAAAIPRRSLYGIVQHARLEYYSDMRGYLDRAYPASYRRGSMHYEQDGLTLRVCESESKRCVWPRRPRTTHVGFHGYHMAGKPIEGELDEQVAVVKLAMKNPTMLNGLLNGAKPPAMGKCSVCQKSLLTEDKVARLVCVYCFHTEHPDLLITTSSHYYLAPDHLSAVATDAAGTTK